MKSVREVMVGIIVMSLGMMARAQERHPTEPLRVVIAGMVHGHVDGF